MMTVKRCGPLTTLVRLATGKARLMLHAVPATTAGQKRTKETTQCYSFSSSWKSVQISSVRVCVRVCVRARARVCVCVS